MILAVGTLCGVINVIKRLYNRMLYIHIACKIQSVINFVIIMLANQTRGTQIKNECRLYFHVLSDYQLKSGLTPCVSNYANPKCGNVLKL